MSTTIFTTLTHITCCKCGLIFGVEASHVERLRTTHEQFYCPSGHGQGFYGKTEVEKRAEVAESNALWYRQRAEAAQREATIQTHRARGLKAAQTRLKNRIKKGVCPHCNRYFENLHRHMTGQHPDKSTAISVLPHDPKENK
jgi:hypothetical protein